ncbi:RHS repeat-associated core domain-containing protein, partial [Desulfovibrio oxamicus]
VVKRMEYDSFGNPLLDTCPYFFLPLGFAGGLADRHTGLVRFGFRDYYPRTGRFTAPDPLGDTGGDHDPYDYCVDDPVSAFDPLGLIGEAIIGQGWDESKHPRDDIGRFTFADARRRGGSETGTQAGNSTQHAPTAGTGQAKGNIGTKSHEIAQQLRPWWTYPYGSKEKQEGISKIQGTLKPELSEWGNTMLDLGMETPNGPQILTEEAIDGIRNKLQSDKEKKLKKNQKNKPNNQ